jgi:hypothetical protein
MGAWGKENISIQIFTQSPELMFMMKFLVGLNKERES